MNSADIADRIVQAILAQRLMPGARLGEQALSMLFDCSRTLVREALMQLAARGIVQVSSRKGWFVVNPSEAEAREAFDARLVIETGLIRRAGPLQAAGLARLKEHLAQEQAAVAGSDVGQRSYLLGDFHVCLAECLGNQLLADTLRDYTARTVLIAMLYQSGHDAVSSCQEHEAIVLALERGDRVEAERLMTEHIGHVIAALQQPSPADPLAELRQALAPLTRGAPPKAAVSGPADTADTDSPSLPSTYLGAVL